MIKEEFTFLSSDKKTNIHVISCSPLNSKGTKILQIIHGKTEYIEKYLPFMEYLTSKGFIVIGNDLLGHGDSITNSDNKGYFGEPDPVSLLIQDIHTLRIMTQEKYENIPYFMLGHSMGSFFLRQYITIYGENLSGVILMGTSYIPSCATSIALKILSLVACFKGWHHKSSCIKKLMQLGDFKEDFNNSYLTRDPEVAKILYTDPKSNFDFTLNGLYGFFKSVQYSCESSNFTKIRKDLPILFVSGQNDSFGSNGSAVEKCFNMMKSLGCLDVTMKLFENDRHEILQEPDKTDVYEYIQIWMEKKSLINNNINKEDSLYNSIDIEIKT